MASEIKLFSYVQYMFARIGINPPDANQRRLSNSKNAFFFVYNTHLFISMVISCITAAATFFEFALSFYLCTTSVVIITLYILNIFLYGSVLELIEKFEQFIEQSKLR